MIRLFWCGRILVPGGPFGNLMANTHLKVGRGVGSTLTLKLANPSRELTVETRATEETIQIRKEYNRYHEQSSTNTGTSRKSRDADP